MKTQKKLSYFKSDDEFQVLDIHQMFIYYNNYFFDGILDKCTVQWSQRMTLCAGSCANTYGISCVIKLSAPLLKYRTANELKQTLLHEMIHAACLYEGGHGKEFKEIMGTINSITGLNITVFHSFNDEVDLYKKHMWKCDGPCKQRPPFYGIVKRSMNRRPQPADRWFNQHQRTCGGNFVKISGPPELDKKSKPKSKEKQEKKRSWGSGKSIQDYFKEMESKGNKKKPVQGKKTKTIEDYFKKQQKTSTNAFEGNGKSIQDYAKQLQLQNNNQNGSVFK